MRRSSSSPLDIIAVGAVAVVLMDVSAGAESLHSVPTFSSGVEVVNLSLSVTDRKLAFVDDIESQELTVFEDGIRQQIALFSRGKAPLSLAILIDGSASMSPRLATAQAAAMRLVGILGPEDEAQVVQFDRRYRVLQDFTSDVPALDAAVHAIQANGDTALYNAVYVALGELAADRPGELRRRAIVVLTDGEDTASLISDDQVLDRARRAEINVYTIGLRSARAGITDSYVPTFFLSSLARETGGRSYFPSSLSDLDGAYQRIAEELRTLYVVGYVSTNPRPDGKWRRIAIQTGRSNLLVHHRPGYYAGARREAARLTDGALR